MNRVYVSLRSGQRIRSIYREGAHRSIGGISVYSGTADIESPEVCFVASTRVGNAVARNRAKRRLREAARHIEFEPATAHVFVARRAVLDVPFDTLVEWMSTAVDSDRSVGADL